MATFQGSGKTRNNWWSFQVFAASVLYNRGHKIVRWEVSWSAGCKMTSDGNQLCLSSEVRKPGQHTKVAERRGTWDEHATKETWTPNHQTKADYASSKLQLLHKTVQGQTRAILQGKVLEWLLQRANWILPEHQYRKPGSQTWKSIGLAGC